MKSIVTCFNLIVGPAAVGLLTLCFLQTQANAHLLQQQDRKAKMAKPDLSIRQFLFPPANDKALRVHVVNTGKAPSGACRLVLTVRKINGVAVGRRTHVNVPILAPGADVWLHIDAKSILPNNISLQSTTIKLNVDATGLIAESDESNNEVWHGLPATAAIGEPIGGFVNDSDEASAGTDGIKYLVAVTQMKANKPPPGCISVSRRWFVCGKTNFKNKVAAGVGISFNRLDPNGKIVTTRSYKDCSELAADSTIPADIRMKAAGPCKQSF